MMNNKVACDIAFFILPFNFILIAEELEIDKKQCQLLSPDVQL